MQVKAIPAPTAPVAADPQVDRAQQSISRIKMRTNASPERFSTPEPVTEEPSKVAVTDESAISDNDSNEQVESAEEKKPLSPQFAALAKEKRALQVKESELAKREAALNEASKTPSSDEFISKADILANPLKIFEAGLTYDQLTEAILSGSGTGANPEINALKAEIQALKQGLDKTLSDRDQQAEKQVLDGFKREADKLAFSGDEFELVREEKRTQDVVDRIHAHYKETGEILEVREAMQLVEDELVEKHLKAASYKKIQSRLSATAQPNKPAANETSQSQIKTLTNRDTARPVDDRKARAIAAMQGTLKR